MTQSSEFYNAFFAGVTNAGLEIRDHWHPEDDTAVTYKLREPRSGKTMRYTVKYASAENAEAGTRAAAEAVARFFGGNPRP